jgi:hypothetical protein
MKIIYIQQTWLTDENPVSVLQLATIGIKPGLKAWHLQSRLNGHISNLVFNFYNTFFL